MNVNLDFQNKYKLSILQLVLEVKSQQMGLTAVIPKCTQGCFSYGDSFVNLILGPLVCRGCLYPMADGCLSAKHHSDFSVHHHRNFWNCNFAYLFHFKRAFVIVDSPNYPRQSLHFKFSLIIYVTPCCHRQMTYSQLPELGCRDIQRDNCSHQSHCKVCLPFSSSFNILFHSSVKYKTSHTISMSIENLFNSPQHGSAICESLLVENSSFLEL